MIDHLANRLEQFSCIAFFPPYITLSSCLHKFAWQPERFGRIWGRDMPKKKTLQEQQLQIEKRQNNFNKTWSLFSPKASCYWQLYVKDNFLKTSLLVFQTCFKVIIIQIRTSAPESVGITITIVVLEWYYRICRNQSLSGHFKQLFVKAGVQSFLICKLDLVCGTCSCSNTE